MKLTLSFDEQTAASTLQQVISAAGANSTINISSAHAVNPTVLLQLANTAGNHKRLGASFNGAQLAGNGLSQFISASGTNTRCSVNTAQSTAISTLLDAINVAGDAKALSAEFNGAQLVSDNLQRSIIAAGLNTSVSVNSAQASDVSTLLWVIDIAGDSKKFGASFNGAQLVGSNLQQVLAASGANTRIILNTAQLVADNLQQAATAAGKSTSISINTAQAANVGALLQVLGVVGSEKNLEMDFNGAQLQSDNLQRVLAAAGIKTSVSVNTAQAVGIDPLIQILGVAGNTKSLSAEFNGAQLVANDLQRVVRSSGTNVSVSVNSAQSVPVSTLLDIINVAG